MNIQEILKNLYPVIAEDGKANEFRLHDGVKSDFTFNQVVPLSRLLSRESKEEQDKILTEIKDELNKNLNWDVQLDKNKLLINYTNEYLEEQINHLLETFLESGKLQIPQKDHETVLVDSSSPNISKEMHVGHLRSTIIGECLSRLFEYLGDNVIRINHVGDWGTQFGMLIHYLKSNKLTQDEIMNNIAELNKLYKESKKRFDASEDFKESARNETYKLQQGDPENIQIWKKLCQVSMDYFNKIYEILGTHSEVKGESFYQPYMVKLIEDLAGKDRLEDYEGMKVVYSEKNKKEGENNHLILVKKDGAFTYDTSDLAALHYRITEQHADKILYVVDLGQELHFKTLFNVYSDLYSYTKQNEQNIQNKEKGIYVGFGAVLGADGKKLKTRSGETVKLSGLIEEAYEHARGVTKEMSHGKFENQTEILESISKKIAINCIKYADLSNPRTGSYKYDAKKMMNTKGNTAVYLMYAMARCKSILRKIPSSFSSSDIVLEQKQQKQNIKIENPESRALVYLILKYEETILKASETFCPHILCNYLYNLVGVLTKYYEKNRCIEFSSSSSVCLEKEKEKEILSVAYHRVNLIKLALSVISLMFNLISLEEVEEL